MKKLNARKLLFLPKDKYHDGDGLYIYISSPGKGKWSFRYTINKKAREDKLSKTKGCLLNERDFLLEVFFFKNFKFI